MARKSQVYISERAREVLGALRPDESLSGRINATVDRYGELIAAAQLELATLTADDWHMIRAATLSWATHLEPATMILDSLAAEISDAADGGDLDGANVSALLAKIAAISPAARLAIIERIERGE